MAMTGSHVWIFITFLRLRSDKLQPGPNRCSIHSSELNHTLPNGGWSIALTICCSTGRVVQPGKMGPRNCYICSGFRRLWHLMANILWMKRDIDNGQGHWKVWRVFYIKFHELWSTNGLKRDRTFTHPHYFVLSQCIAHPQSGIKVALHSDSKWITALDLSAA